MELELCPPIPLPSTSEFSVMGNAPEESMDIQSENQAEQPVHEAIEMVAVDMR